MTSDLERYPTISQVTKFAKDIVEIHQDTDTNLFPEINIPELRDALNTVKKHKHKTIVRDPEYKRAVETLTEELPLDHLDPNPRPLDPSEYVEKLDNGDSQSQKVEMKSGQIPHCQELSSIGSLGETEIEFSPAAFRDYVFNGAIEEDTIYFASGLEREDIEEIADHLGGQQFKLGETKIRLSSECDGRKVFVDGAPSIYRMPTTDALFEISKL
jgi:hypothetical protein